MRSPVDQITLMRMVAAMPEGNRVKLSLADLRKCAEGSLTSLLFDRVRESDIDQFLAQISANWNVSVFRNLLDGTATLTKKPAEAQPRLRS